MGESFDAWKKGGLRQSVLEEAVPNYLPAARIGPLFVLAAADDKLLVLGLKRPAIFGATIASIESETPLTAPTVEWTGGSFRVSGKQYFPIPFHDEDAARLASRCQAPHARSTAI
jgi:hypothetical protein